ncbi:MAG: hypothetical protein JJ896_01340 [Rhodothermales bacterium]|nr:hypothetical protein [Rhodothermales bacterium]MBO6778272.1 hypothetical protein [Rhodothermales bacterium]
MRLWYPLLLFALLLPIAGCSEPEPVDLSLPEVWQSDLGVRWWISGTDTSRAFRDLETLQSMGVDEKPIVYDATVALTAAANVSQDRLVRYVKQSLLPLFRNQPDVVDSLFDAYVTPKILREGTSGDPGADVARFKRDGFRIIYRHYHEPRTILKLGEDIPISIPDSLKVTAGGRAVSFQVYVNEEGVPAAIEQLSGVHPVLDRIALLSTIEMRWQPAYLLRGRKSEAIPSWVRFRIRFPS